MLFQAVPLPNPSPNQNIFTTMSNAALMPSTLTAANLKNALAQVDLQYAAPKYQADIGLTNAQSGLANAQATQYPFLNALTQAKTQAVPSEMALNYAQASRAPAQNALDYAQATRAPSQNALDTAQAGYYKALPKIEQQKADQMGARFGQTYQYTKTIMAMPVAMRAAYLANNPDAYNTLLTTLGNTALAQLLGAPQVAPGGQPPYNQGAPLPQLGNQAVVGQPVVPGVQPGFGAPVAQVPPYNPNALHVPTQGVLPPQQTAPGQQGAPVAPQQIPTQQPTQNALNAPAPIGTGGAQIAPQAQPNALNAPIQQAAYPQFQATPQSTAQLQKAAELSANKALTTGKTNTRSEAGVALENMLNQPVVQQSFDTLAQYSGMMGKGQAYLKRFTSPEEYAKIQSATEQVQRVLAGSIGTLEGYPTSDFGAQQGLHFFKMANQYIANNPQAAYDYFNKGLDALHAEAQSLQAAASPIFTDEAANRLPTAPQSLGPQPGGAVAPQAVQGVPTAAPQGQVPLGAPQGQSAQAQPQMVMVSKGDKHFQIPAANLNEAVTRGWKRSA